MSAEIKLMFLLILTFQLKQFFCDFAWQTSKMVMKKASPDWDFIPALSAHAGIHASMTLVIALVYRPTLWWLVFFDFFVHFTMDRIKSGPKYLGRFNDITTHSYWKVFGLDQMVHHLTHYTMIYLIITCPA